MDRLLPFFFEGFVQSGTLRGTAAGGGTVTLGGGPGPAVAVRFTSRKAQWAVLLDPELRLGEAYMNGTFVIEQGSIADVLAMVMASDASSPLPRWLQPQWLLRHVWRRLQQFHPPAPDLENVPRAYNVDARLRSLFLDPRPPYSSAHSAP